MQSASPAALKSPIGILCLVLLLTGLLSGRTKVDEQLWTNIALQKSLTGWLDIELEEHLRLGDHYSTLKKNITQIGLSAGITRSINLTVAYRHSRLEDGAAWRRHLALTLKTRVGRLRIRHRLQAQAEKETAEVLEKYLRNKLTGRYALSNQLSPYIEAELYHLMENATAEYRKYRLALGVRVNLRANRTLKVFFRRQQEVNRKEPDRWNIVGLKYEYDF